MELGVFQAIEVKPVPISPFAWIGGVADLVIQAAGIVASMSSSSAHTATSNPVGVVAVLIVSLTMILRRAVR
jgi:hypothetical protein